MRIPAILLLASTFAMAIPLRKGASLGYKVWRGWESDSTFATLTVLDSTKTDSGTVWNVGIRDSLVGGDRIRQDTATLWVRGDTDTVWQKPSCLAAWDPSSRVTSGGAGGVLPYGTLAGVCHGKTPAQYSINRGIRIFTTTLEDLALFIPASAWLPDTGLCRLHDTVSSEDWRLVSVDGGSIPIRHFWDTTSILLAGLSVGESWTWDVEGAIYHNDSMNSRPIDTSKTTSTSRIRWMISGAQTDSTGWIRRTISSGDSSTEVRIEPATGHASSTFSDSASNFLLAGMLGLWSDSRQAPDQWTRRSYQATFFHHGGVFKDISDSSRLDLRKGVGPDEVAWVTTNHNGAGGCGCGHMTTGWTRIRLLVHNSDTLRTSSLSTRRNQPAGSSLNSVANLRQELTDRPGSNLRVTEISGRSRVYPAKEAMTALRPRRGIVMVELRDGSFVASGMLLLP